MSMMMICIQILKKKNSKNLNKHFLFLSYTLGYTVWFYYFSNIFTRNKKKKIWNNLCLVNNRSQYFFFVFVCFHCIPIKQNKVKAKENYTKKLAFATTIRFSNFEVLLSVQLVANLNVIFHLFYENEYRNNHDNHQYYHHW